MAARQKPPFEEWQQLFLETDSNPDLPCTNQFLPGQPRVPLDDKLKLRTFLKEDLIARDLERMAPRLWMMSKQSGQNISPLHRQKIKRREIVITEDPRLHLVWYHNQIFIKPLPRYLLSYDFWNKFLLLSSSPLGEDKDVLLPSARGLLRTYYYLIKHKSDFDIAQNPGLRLIPQDVSWKQFCDFSSRFCDIEDHEVSERYSYGEIRLTRLNFYAKFFLRRRWYQRIDTQYSDYFAVYYGPLLFSFAIISVALSAMQLEMNAEQLLVQQQWVDYWQVCRWFSIVFLGFSFCSALVLWTLLMYKICLEWAYALSDRRKKRKARTISPKIAEEP